MISRWGHAAGGLAGEQEGGEGLAGEQEGMEGLAGEGSDRMRVCGWWDEGHGREGGTRIGGGM